ncbi:hypothetical protein DITRI_Ditri03aG0088900 [Diplodiscus trichospermus]
MATDKTSLAISSSNQTNPLAPISINTTAQLPLKLNSINYPSWLLQFTSLLSGYDLTDFLTGNNPCPNTILKTENTQIINPAYTFWQRQDKSILHTIVASITEPIVPLIATEKTSQETWERLSKMFANKIKQ